MVRLPIRPALKPSIRFTNAATSTRLRICGRAPKDGAAVKHATSTIRPATYGRPSLHR